MPHQFTVLHLSDLHERGPRDKERVRRYRVLGDAWQRNLDDLLNEGPIDLVCFTGDLADWGQAKEYEGISTLLDAVLRRLGLGRERLFLVPGNHDIDRKILSDRTKKSPEQEAFEKLRSNLHEAAPVAISRWLEGGKPPFGFEQAWLDLTLSRQSAYREFLRTFGLAQQIPNAKLHPHLGYRVSLQLPKLPFPVQVLGLDSSWLAGDDADSGRLRLTDGQVMKLCLDSEGRALPGFRLALVHHPLSDLADASQCRTLLADSVDLLLRGHLHETELTEWADPDRKLRAMAAGCLYEGDRADQYPNSCSVIRVQCDEAGRPQRYDVRLRSFSARNGHWFDDGGIYRNAPNGRLTIQLVAPSPSSPQRSEPRTIKVASPSTTPESRTTTMATAQPIELTIEHVKAACARLVTTDAQGTGYLVRPDRLVTCAHVVRSVGVGGRVQAQFAGMEQGVEATVEQVDDAADWAVLRLSSPVAGTPSLPRGGAATTDSRWLAFGYPAIAGERGIAIGGVVRDPAGKDAQGSSAIQLFCDEAAAARGAVLGGASGAPVISGGRIIGHLRRVLPDEEDRAQLGTLFACSTLSYESALPTVDAVQQFRARSLQFDYDPLWYIPRRDAELLALNKLRDAGVPVTLQAPEGFGKRWMVEHLLERISQQDLAAGQRTEVVRFNLRTAVNPAPSALEELLMSLLRAILEQLGVERVDALLSRASKTPGDGKHRFRRAFEKHVLSRNTNRILVIVEEADHLHRTPVETDFFAVLRAMAENTSQTYQRLRLLVTIGAEAGFLETTNHSAFFGLSLPIVLDGFTLTQLRSEALLYGLSANDPGLHELHRLTSGHPLFARLAMHEATCGEKTLGQVFAAMDARGGVFASSLQRLRLYVEREGLKPALCSILASPRYNLPAEQYLLLYRKGLVVETNPGEYRLRCPLFEDYFRALCQ